MSARTEPVQQDLADALACLSRYLCESYERQQRIEEKLDRLDRKAVRMLKRQRRVKRKPYERPEVAAASSAQPLQQALSSSSPPQSINGPIAIESDESSQQLFGCTEDISKFRDGHDKDGDDAARTALTHRDATMKEYREARQIAGRKLAVLSPTASQEEEEEEAVRSLMPVWMYSRDDDEEEDDDDDSFIVPDDASLEVETGSGSSEQTPPTMAASLGAVNSSDQPDPKDWRELLPDHFKAASARRIARRSRLIEFISDTESNKLDAYEAHEHNMQKMISHPYYVEALQQRSVYRQFYGLSKGVKYKLWEQLAMYYVLGLAQVSVRGSNAGRCVVVDLPYGHAYAVADSVSMQRASATPDSVEWSHCSCPYYDLADKCVKCAFCGVALSPTPEKGLTVLIVPHDFAGGQRHRETVGRLGSAFAVNVSQYVARKAHEALRREPRVNGMSNDVRHDLYAIGATCRARFNAMAYYLETLVCSVYAECRSPPTRDAHGYSSTVEKFENIIDDAMSKFRACALKIV